MPTPDWPVLGARVAEYRRDGEPAITTVTRLTETQIITRGPRRYYRATLKAVGDRQGYELRPLTDPDVARARACAALEHVANHAETLNRTVRSAVEGYGPAGYDRTKRLDRDDATRAFRAALHDIADMVSKTIAYLDDTAERPDQVS